MNQRQLTQPSTTVSLDLQSKKWHEYKHILQQILQRSYKYLVFINQINSWRFNTITPKLRTNFMPNRQSDYNSEYQWHSTLLMQCAWAEEKQVPEGNCSLFASRYTCLYSSTSTLRSEAVRSVSRLTPFDAFKASNFSSNSECGMPMTSKSEKKAESLS